MLEFILASGNPHKAQEFAELFAQKMRIQSAPKSLDPEENGATFMENALIKARAYYEVYGVPTLADDSGLTIEALPDILGVQSARFKPESPQYEQKCQAVLDLLENQVKREAHFTCVLCFYLSAAEVYYFEGRLHGQIAHELSGEQGFGYDPIFVPTRPEADGKTLAELPEWKNLHSHRARAAQAASRFFASRNW